MNEKTTMQQSDRKELQSEVGEMMKKMFFSQPVINRYLEKAGLKELENMKILLEDERNVRTVSRRTRFLKSANFPTMKSFDDYDFKGIKFPKNFTKDENAFPGLHQ